MSRNKSRHEHQKPPAKRKGDRAARREARRAQYLRLQYLDSIGLKCVADLMRH